MPTLEIEEKVARLEGRVDEHSRFFESLSVKLTNLEAKGDRNKEDIEKKIDRYKEDLEKKIKDVEEKIDKTKLDLEAKIDKTKLDLEAKIDDLKDRIRELEVKMSSFKAEIIKWMFLFWIGQLVVIAGLIKWLR